MVAFTGAGRAAENVCFSAACFQKWGIHSCVGKGRVVLGSSNVCSDMGEGGRDREREASGPPSYVDRLGRLWLRAPQAFPLPLFICPGTLLWFKLFCRVGTASVAFILQGFCNLLSQDVL